MDSEIKLMPGVTCRLKKIKKNVQLFLRRDKGPIEKKIQVHNYVVNYFIICKYTKRRTEDVWASLIVTFLKCN